MCERTITAAEVLQKSKDQMLLLGGTYSRLQEALLTPLIDKAKNILESNDDQ